jgi:hypothetical protein
MAAGLTPQPVTEEVIETTGCGARSSARSSKVTWRGRMFPESVIIMMFHD